MKENFRLEAQSGFTKDKKNINGGLKGSRYHRKMSRV